MEPNGPVRVRLVPFVHSQSYKQIRVHLDPNIHHLAGYPLGLPQGPLGSLDPTVRAVGLQYICMRSSFHTSYRAAA